MDGASRQCVRDAAHEQQVGRASEQEVACAPALVHRAFDGQQQPRGALHLIQRHRTAGRYNLRSVTAGWTPELRAAYFQWFQNFSQGGDEIYNDAYRIWFARVGRRPTTVGNDGPPGLALCDQLPPDYGI